MIMLPPLAEVTVSQVMRQAVKAKLVKLVNSQAGGTQGSSELVWQHGSVTLTGRDPPLFLQGLATSSVRVHNLGVKQENMSLI